MNLIELMENLPYGPAPEDAGPALAWLSSRQRFSLFIGGEWLEPQSGEWFPTYNPANGRPLAEVAQAGPADVDRAVQAARAAFPAWRDTPPHARARYLYAMARQVQKHARLFAVLETLDSGKPIREARDIDIPLVVRHFYYHAGWAQLMDQAFAGYEPLGVVGQIIPWNFPLLMLAWKVAPALATGNTVVLKPAELTPLTALLFAEVCQRVGLPPGVVNILTGDGRTGAALVEHPGVDKIAFTGSTEVGRQIRRATAGSGKRLALELGGKSPFIVFEDADLDSAVEGVVDAIWFNQGQVCCAGSRLLLQEGIAERMYAKLKARMEKLRVGDPLDKAVDMGAIIAPAQLEKIKRLVQKGQEEGALLWQPSWAVPEEGCFYPPTLFTQVAPASTLAQEEIFGPVLAALTFRTPEEAVRLANNTRYGLSASIWSEDVQKALEVAMKLKAGTVWINSTNLFDAASGFGGYRESGFEREGGKEGLWAYLKRTTSRKPQPPGPDRLPERSPSPGLPPIDRTVKLFIGGKQARPDSGYSQLVYAPDGRLLGEVPLGNRKDIRNAVEAARGALEGWRGASAHQRAQILYFLAENLAERAQEFARRLGEAEVEASIEALFTAAAWADKHEGMVHPTPFRGLTLALMEPVGVLGIVCPDDWPLLALARLAGTALALGNTLVVVPSPLVADFYQVLESSDLPAGVFNLVTGVRDELAQTLAEHDDVDALWYAGPREGWAMVERASAGNMKRTWTLPQTGPLPEVEEVLRRATEVKNIWLPYGA
ncbi:aldehyde dehydrogenase family protein [Meiothermus sp. QL-1]|uniref:aldehyde dehydrogenase family protein n=1 Tax=Meiothermus sp. QL-1 TaxID=2058095 RepID=UPI000E0B8E18|nr:aldehyde dehydrogenase family protein [Meiothermus sp. QL-1]RDI95485.1 aldehyde dehydrogenase family protein [Meiothermus sp. QL-1]